MKKWMVFVLGIFVGLILMGIVNTLKISSEDPKNNETEIIDQKDDGTTWFDEPGDIMNTNARGVDTKSMQIPKDMTRL